MEDTKSLLMMVLHKIFQNQPKTIENMFQLIHSFNNGKIEKRHYEKTLKTICDLMNDELPSPILVYILTLVDMPQDFDSQSPLIEKMRKTHDFLPSINVRPHLLEYLNNIKTTSSIKSQHSDVVRREERMETITSSNKEFCKEKHSQSIKQSKDLKKRKVSKNIGSPKSLLDICANYVVRNENTLKIMYKKKQSLAWALINSNSLNGSQLNRCYDVVKDLNKKTKWLREIESQNVSTDLLMEEYKNSDIFLKESNMFLKLKRDPFTLSPECEKLINSFFI